LHGSATDIRSFDRAHLLTLHSTVGYQDSLVVSHKSRWARTNPPMFLPSRLGDGGDLLSTGDRSELRLRCMHASLLTKDDLATIQYTNHFIPRSLIMIDL
jgi:hypothetical protein